MLPLDDRPPAAPVSRKFVSSLDDVRPWRSSPKADKCAPLATLSDVTLPRPPRGGTLSAGDALLFYGVSKRSVPSTIQVLLARQGGIGRLDNGSAESHPRDDVPRRDKYIRWIRLRDTRVHACATEGNTQRRTQNTLLRLAAAAMYILHQAGVTLALALFWWRRTQRQVDSYICSGVYRIPRVVCAIGHRV